MTQFGNEAIEAVEEILEEVGIEVLWLSLEKRKDIATGRMVTDEVATTAQSTPLISVSSRYVGTTANSNSAGATGARLIETTDFQILLDAAYFTDRKPKAGDVLIFDNTQWECIRVDSAYVDERVAAYRAFLAG